MCLNRDAYMKSLLWTCEMMHNIRGNLILLYDGTTHMVHWENVDKTHTPWDCTGIYVHTMKINYSFESPCDSIIFWSFASSQASLNIIIMLKTY